MSVKQHPVPGKRPWPASQTAEAPYEELAPRQHAPYVCTRGHQFTVTFAADVAAPAAWECRCGAPAGATPPADAEDEHDRRMTQVLSRRTGAELEELLDQRLTEIRADPPACTEGTSTATTKDTARKRRAGPRRR